MNMLKERILLVETDPVISDLVERQALQPLGYKVDVVGSMPAALQEVLRLRPDVIVADLNLPGLSGKDLLVALSAQGVNIPVIVIAPQGMENDVIQAFRLGASDFVAWPIREAEVVSAVERVLRQGRSRREREQLAQQLDQKNQELQRRVQELTTIFAIGKAVVSTTDQVALFDKILEGAVFVTEADSAWLLSRDERSKSYILRACRNLPGEISTHINQPYDDGLSSLVALSGESLSIHGAPLQRFKASRLGQSALVIPIKVKKEVVGLLVSTRKAPIPFTASQQALLEAVADYASISMVNARLFRALEERLASLQQSADSAQIDRRIQEEIVHEYNRELTRGLSLVKNNLIQLAAKDLGKLSGEQVKAVLGAQDRLSTVQQIIDSMHDLHPLEAGKPKQPVDLSELARQAVKRFQPIAQLYRLQILPEIPARMVHIQANTQQISKALDGLFVHALRFTSIGAPVTLRLEATSIETHLSIQVNGAVIDPELLSHLFEASYENRVGAPARFGGIGISLLLVKEILEAHGGKAWAGSLPEKGYTLHITLPVTSH